MLVGKQNGRQTEQERECYSLGSVIPPGEVRDTAASKETSHLLITQACAHRASPLRGLW